ncbi:Glyoxalase-like domain protein [Streptomyces sp. YIM 130001]|uniref:VOC family protein n=1 Tax=Streptomyces sp. YIM 130001 TaxID=2259644 RepID=UPI000E64C7FB|nr:VOC family protein [Streptomyces sp. YIM 130001]RII20828.1 Glyoxalase-like domain protein [Streptomyces sp. YIM 130001]
MSLDLLGFDNVLLPVGDLGAAVEFYRQAGFPLSFRLDEAGVALFKVGPEMPGVLLRHEEGMLPGPPHDTAPRAWLEVPDAKAAARALEEAGVAVLGKPFSVSTGYTVEIADPWGNVLGFTDYLKRPELARG